MELVCRKCGYKIDVGGNLDPNYEGKKVCSECGSTDVRLVDVGGINIKVDGINEDTIVHVIKELAKNVNVYDVFSFLANQGQGKKKDKNDELDLGGK
jgi:hypothetical protein